MSFLELLSEAVFNTNNDQRTEAERRLFALKEQNAADFLANSLQVLTNDQQNPALRQAAASLIKRTIMPDSETNNTLWNQLAPEAKNDIKTLLLQTLLSREILVKRGAADVISTICGIELPTNSWPDIIPLLAKNTGHQDIEIKKSAIITLGYICENLKNSSFQLPTATVESILLGICLGLGQEQDAKDVKLVAVSALDDSLSLLDPVFNNQDVLKYTLERLFECCMSTDFEIKKRGYQCLVSFGKIHYDRVSPYLNDIFNLMAQEMQQQSETAISAIEFWNTLAVEDKERRDGSNEQGKAVIHRKKSQQYLSQIHFNVVPILLRNLLNQKGDDEDDEMSVAAASFHCLSAICEAVGDPVLEQFTQFIDVMVQSRTATERVAGLRAFTCMLDGPSEQNLTNLITQALLSLVGMLFDEKLKVRDAAAQCICRIAELRADCILYAQNVVKVVPELIRALDDKQQISQHVCICFNFLADSSAQYLTDDTFKKAWEMYVEQIIAALIKNAYRSDIGDNFQLIELSFLAIITLIYNSSSGQLQSGLLEQFIQAFKNAVATQSNKNESLQACLLSAMQICILKIKNFPAEGMKMIYELITEYFKAVEDVNSDGIYVISALATSAGQHFAPLLPDFWEYLKHAMQKANEPEVINAIFGAIQDISRASKAAFEPYVQPSLEFLDACLNNHALSKELRLGVFTCFGDIALAVRGRLLPQLQNLLRCYEMAYQGGLQLIQLNTPESLDHLEALKDKLIESMTCIVHAFSDIRDAEQFLGPNFGPLFQFIHATCDKSLNPTVEYIRNCLALEIDVIEFYSSSVLSVANPGFINDLIQMLRKFDDNTQTKQIIDYATKKMTQWSKH